VESRLDVARKSRANHAPATRKPPSKAAVIPSQQPITGAPDLGDDGRFAIGKRACVFIVPIDQSA
jgi:hypothetical protein